MNDSPRPFGKYFLLQKIATGGMAEIYKAKTFGADGFEKIVVIKKVLPHWASDPDFVRMLKDEAKLSVLLNHPNIVEVFDLGSVDHETFIAMEYVEGADLKSLMNGVAAKGAKVIPAVAAFIAMQVAEGLDYAHKKVGADGIPLGIIHRDVSPHNILLSNHGEVKITDFGIAKATSKKSFTATGTLKGKFNYMSPEQVKSEPLTPKTDLFSLGLVLYEMLTGKKAFDADTEVGIIEKIKHAQIDLSQAPEEFREILAKSLQSDVATRYESAEAMQMDLAQVLAKIHPGFLPKNLAEFIRAYPPEPKPIEQTQSQGPSPLSSPISQSAKTSISYIPGYNAPPPKKGRSIWVWLLPLLLLFFGSIAVAGYLAWTQVIQPRLAAKIPASPPAVAPAPPVTPPAPVAPAPPPPPVQPVAPPPPAVAESQPATLPATPQAAMTGTLGAAPVPESAPATQPATTQPTAAAPVKIEMGQADVVSTPEGALIFVDDQPTNMVTPAVVGNLTLNQPHRIRLMKAGYLPLEAVYMPTNSQLTRLNLPLRPAPVADFPRRRRPLYRSEGGSAPLRQTPPTQNPGDSGIMIWR